MKSRQVIELKTRQYDRLIADAGRDMRSGKMSQNAMMWLSDGVYEWRRQRDLLLWVLET